MGVGMVLSERVKLDESTGELLTNSTWNYKPPLAKNIPRVLNVTLAQNPFEQGICSSKASGEPPLVLSSSVLMAVRQAVAAAREDAGNAEDFVLNAPTTPDNIVELCGVTKDVLAQSLQ